MDAELAQLGIELIAPHRRNRKKPKTQDGRPLRRYKRRWKIERLFAWLGTSVGWWCATSATRSTTSASFSSAAS
jgi:hypothetical protein